MKLLTFLGNWYDANRKKHIEKMRLEGKCPICKGVGFETIATTYIGHTVECHSCNGTGLYTEWEKSNV